jgi:hypothetical protein
LLKYLMKMCLYSQRMVCCSWGYLVWCDVLLHEHCSGNGF